LHDDNGNVADSAEYRQRIPDSQSPSRYRAALGALPLAWSIVSISYGLAILPSDQVRIMEAVNELFTTVPLTGVVLAVQVILGVLLCWLACRIRIVSATSTRWWMMTGFFIGPATALAILTVYPKVIRSSCAACGNATRVDRCECEHCDEPLSPVSRLGIEIFDSEETMPSNRRAEAIAS
jgi:hypothetical protein